jgi:hypothetical protein
MPADHSSDAAIDVLRVCRDGIRFRFALELHVPRFHPEGPPGKALPTRYQWIQAASPPPTRDGAPWEDGIRINDGTREDRAFRPTDPGGDDAWRQYGVFCEEGAPSLDRPKPDTIVLHQRLAVPFEWARKIPFHQKGVRLKGFLSVPYPLELPDDDVVDGVVYVGVNYFGEYTLAWTRPLKQGAWVAISFDDFHPPERGSADYIVQVENYWLFKAAHHGDQRVYTP